MTAMLRDPLIQAMMRSDGVSEEAHTALWLRARDAVLARTPVSFHHDELVVESAMA